MDGWTNNVRSQRVDGTKFRTQKIRVDGTNFCTQKIRVDATKLHTERVDGTKFHTQKGGRIKESHPRDECTTNVRIPRDCNTVKKII